MRSIIKLYGEVLDVLPKGARRYLIGYMIGLAALAILDGVALGLLAAVTSPILGKGTLKLPLLGEINDTGLLIMLALVCVLIIAKAVIAVLLMWSATRRFANYEWEIGRRLFESYIHAPWTERLKRNSAELVRLTDSSVGVTVSAFLLPGAALLGEGATFVIILAVLAIAQPILAIVAFVYLFLIGLILFYWVTGRSRANGRINQQHSVRNVRLITEMIAALKEVSLRNKLDEVGLVIQKNRRVTTKARANLQFFAQVPRYVLESAIIGGVVIVGLTGFLVGDGGVTGMLTAVAIFGLAGFRLAPSLMRFQNVVSLLSATQPAVEAVMNEIKAVEHASKHLEERPSQPLAPHPTELKFEGVSFRYADDAPDAVHDLDLSIPMGSRVAFVGSSGAGKSTIVDLVLGLIEPTKGRISIDGVDLRELTRSWRERVGYVPQEVALFDATVAQNVALSWTDAFDRDQVRASLKQAQLLDIIEGRDDGIDGAVGERGMSLSGGQRQRLGIARALYTKPLVLVMDEATSALDTATEAAVGKAIAKLHGKITLISVAHRLATIRDADRIYFMSGGRVQASGTFDELVASVPEFAVQASLAGLVDPPAAPKPRRTARS